MRDINKKEVNKSVEIVDFVIWLKKFCESRNYPYLITLDSDNHVTLNPKQVKKCII